MSSTDNEAASVRASKNRVPLKKWGVIMVISVTLIWYFFIDPGGWKEEVLLHDGTIIWVHRIERSSHNRAEWGGGGGRVDDLENILTIPRNNPIAPAPPAWKVKHEAPMIVDYDAEKETWFIVVTFYMCGDWINWGAPELPYRQYVVQNGEWVVVPLDESLIGRKGNLTTGLVGRKMRQITIADILKMNRNSGSEYKSVVDTWNGCRSDLRRLLRREQ